MKVLGIAAGSGVIIHPLKKHLVGNVEPRSDYMTPGDEQWLANFEGIPLLPSLPGKSEIGKVYAIVGHPTCGHSSSLAYSRGKKLGNAKKDKTLKLFVKAVKKYKPKVFMFENLTAMYKTYPDFDSNFSDYTLVKHNCSVANFGNSQISRVRLIIIGIHKSINPSAASYFKLPELESSKLKKVLELESKLAYPNADLCHIREDDNTKVCMEKDFRKLTLAEIRDEWNSDKYINRKKWDATTTGKGKMKNLPGVYRNLPDQFPLTARKQNRQFNSKGDIMSPRELARINGIPDSFKLVFHAHKKQYYLNKARVNSTKCPPYELGLWFAKCLYKLKKSLKHGNKKKP